MSAPTKNAPRTGRAEQPTGPRAEHWTTELEQLAMRALVAEYHQINYQLFGDKLRLPTLQLSQNLGQLGLWEPVPPTIRISRAMLVERQWGIVVEVLKHEMAHQFVTEVLGVVEAKAHGPLFQRICAERGIDGAATGLASTDNGSDPSLLNKIRHLLALADSPERHEAEAAAAAAQRLMLKHNLQDIGSSRPRNYCFAHLGTPTGRVEESQRALAAILRDFYFVETIWVGVFRPLEGKRASVLEVCGTRENVELAQYVHSFLNHAAARLWSEHKRAQGIRSDRDRRSFAAGVMAGFHNKLKDQRRVTDEQGLVWQGDPDLNDYYRRRFPRVSSVHYGTSRGTGAHLAGSAAGKGLVLHRGVSAGATTGGRLLRG
jgi:Protein of unknown function (DUF2786)/SprT-like family